MSTDVDISDPSQTRHLARTIAALCEAPRDDVSRCKDILDDFFSGLRPERHIRTSATFALKLAAGRRMAAGPTQDFVTARVGSQLDAIRQEDRPGVAGG